MVKVERRTVNKFTVDEIRIIEGIANIDCDDLYCNHCEAAYDNVYRQCFKGNCKELLEQLDKQGRL